MKVYVNIKKLLLLHCLHLNFVKIPTTTPINQFMNNTVIIQKPTNYYDDLF